MKDSFGVVSKFMTISDCSHYFGISKYQIRKWINEGKLSHTFVGNRYLVETQALEALIYADVRKGDQFVEFEKIFVSIREAVKITGLSEFYLRQELRAGRVPYIKSGTKYLINLPAYINILNAEGGCAEKH